MLQRRHECAAKRMPVHAAIINRAYAWIRTDGWMCACTHVSRHVRDAFLHVRMYSPQSAQSVCALLQADKPKPKPKVKGEKKEKTTKQLLQGIDDAVDKVPIHSDGKPQCDEPLWSVSAERHVHRMHALFVRHAARGSSLSVCRQAAAFAMKHAAMRHAI